MLRIVRNTVFALVVLALAVLAGYLLRLYNLVREIQATQGSILGTEPPKTDQTTKIYANDYNPETGEGTLLGNIYVQNRSYVPLEEIPEKLKLCVLATEDANFYHHKGYDIWAIARAIYVNLKAGGIKEGASTITQQLVRNVYIPQLKYQKTINRKVQELVLAQALEHQFTKEQIFEYYMNYIFFGAGAYGVSAAAETYFGKELDELTLAECALISGLPAAPTDLNPFNNPEQAKSRRDKVLRNLARSKREFEKRGKPLDLSSISQEEIENALKEPLKLAEPRPPDQLKFPWFTSYVREFLYRTYGEDQVLRRGMTVVTTLDPIVQQCADEAVAKGLEEFEASRNVHQAALACVEVDTGYIAAIVGGKNYGVDEGKSVFNRATQAYRQPGSAFKPFTYATALEEGWQPSDWINDNPAKYPMGGNRYYSPKNSDGSNSGEIPLAWGLIKSKNVASVWLINQLGPERVIRTARDMGLTTNLQPYLGLTLGASEVIPLEMAAAFATFPQMGMYIAPTPILYVMDYHGNILEDNRGRVDARSRRALTENTAYTMVQMMKMVNTSGTGRAVAYLGDIMPNAGKTGTTDEHRDAMYIGYTPYYCTAVWAGNDDHSRMRRMFGGQMPARIWNLFNKAVIERKKLAKKDFPVPAGWSGKAIPGFASRGAVSETTEAHAEGSSVVVTAPGVKEVPPGGSAPIKPRPPKQRGE
ncbi:MAG: PBP1A family penicillin-binding protein [bacterium]|jgi:penicillin-binding protein 1A